MKGLIFYIFGLLLLAGSCTQTTIAPQNSYTCTIYEIKNSDTLPYYTITIPYTQLTLQQLEDSLNKSSSQGHNFVKCQ